MNITHCNAQCQINDVKALQDTGLSHHYNNAIRTLSPDIIHL